MTKYTRKSRFSSVLTKSFAVWSFFRSILSNWNIMRDTRKTGHRPWLSKWRRGPQRQPVLSACSRKSEKLLLQVSCRSVQRGWLASPHGPFCAYHGVRSTTGKWRIANRLKKRSWRRWEIMSVKCADLHGSFSIRLARIWLFRKFADVGKTLSSWRRANVLRKPNCFSDLICSIAYYFGKQQLAKGLLLPPTILVSHRHYCYVWIPTVGDQLPQPYESQLVTAKL